MLGAVMGTLIVLPLLTETPGMRGALALLLGAAGGGAVGFRRRTSPAFLYFCIAGILALASVISFSMLPR